jgi:signal transduction histidine kinase
MDYSTAPQTIQASQAIWRLEKIILDSLDFNTVVQKIVDSVLVELGYMKLGYRIVVLALVDEKEQKLKRISISKTPEAEKALLLTPIPFHDINIPLSAKDNISVKAVMENKPYATKNWQEMLCPPYTPEEAIKIQQAIGIKNSMVFPVISKNKAIGVIIFSMSKDAEEVSHTEMDLIKSFTDIVGLAVQNASLYSSLEKASNELQLANERLKQLDKLKDEFVSLASHELRTPMTVIKSYIWMFLHKKGDELDEKDKSYLLRAYSTTERLIKLVNDMLNVSRIESGRLKLEMKDLEIDKLVTTVVNELTPRAKELGLNLSLEKNTESIKLLNGDADRIEEILINFIGNSLKFTPPGGSIKVSLMAREKDVLIAIADNGKGIKKEDMPRLFHKFETMGNAFLQKQQSQGSGLGLYLSKSLIELHGGKVGVESAGENKGSIFSFTLPYNEDRPHQDAAVLPSKPTANGSGVATAGEVAGVAK